MAKQLNVNLAFTADTSQAKSQIQELQATLNQIAYSGNNTTGMNKQTQAIQQASAAAKELQIHLNNAFDVNTGRFDLSKLDKSLKTSGTNIGDLSNKLLQAGETGQQAFAQLAQSISQANQPMFQINKHLSEMWTVMKNTMRWQLSSSMIHGFMGTVQQAYGYVQDLNESLTNIRIVTGYSSEEMASFAKEANKAAKALSTTTTDYTDAALIYYQQGLTEAEVKERTDVTIKMANAAGVSAQTVSDQMTAVWNNFDDGSKSLEYYADVMTALGAATASSTDEISAGLEKFAAIADTVGLSYEYSTAALATITATTRQSADVVGNALKTLFARIQGLSLGETLEDGVDLNKYSKALDTVGVKVLDTNGQMREMDDILNDLAAKWDTIGKAEQTALAQTVAGVRQYTQLVALMDNWDFMKENLQVAYEAEGALQEQADIYAESWEAARDRVQAAAEGIYDSLLNDEFFIDINNGFANLLGGLESFIDGIGGAKGVILAFSSILVSNFSHKIPQAIDNLKYNFVYLTKGTQEAYKNILQDMNSVYSQMDNDQKYSSFGVNVKYSNELTAARNKLAVVSDRMSNSERQLAETELSLIEAQKQELITLKQKNEELYQSINLTMRTEAEDTMDTLGAQAISSVEGTNIAGYLSKEQGAINQMAHEIGSKAMRAVAEGMREGNIDVSQSLQVIIDGFQKIRINENNLEVSKEKIRALINILPEGLQSALGLRDALNSLDTADIEQTRNIVQQLKKQLKDGKILAVDLREVLRSLYGPEWQKILKDVKVLKNGLDEAKNKAQGLSEAFKSFNPTHAVNSIERISQAAAGLGQVAMTINSISSLFKTLSDPDLSGWEKLTASLMSISMIVPGVIGTFKSFNTVLDGALSKSLEYWFSQKVQYIELNKSTLQRIRDEVTLATIGQERQKEEIAAMMAEIAVQEGLINVSEEQIVAEEILNAEKEGGISVSIKRTLAQKLETIGIWDNTASLGANTLALIKNTAAAIANFAAKHPLIAATLALATAVGIAVVADKLYLDTQEKANKKSEEASATLETLKSNYEEAASAVKSLKQAIEDYTNTQDALSKLTEGSIEWKQALIEANAQVMSLLETYPELAKYISSENGVLTISSEGWDTIFTKQVEQMKNSQEMYMAGVGVNSKTQGIKQLTEASIGQSMTIDGVMGDIQVADFGTKMIEILYEEIGVSINTAQEFQQFLQDNDLWDVLGQYSEIDIQKIIDQITTQKLATSTANETGIITAQNLTGEYAEAYAATILNSQAYQDNYNKERNRLDKLNNTQRNEEYLESLYGENYADTHRITDEGMEQVKVGNEWQDVGEIAASAIIDTLAAKFTNENTEISVLDEKLLNQNKNQLLQIEGMTDIQANSILAEHARTGVWDTSQLSWDQILSFNNSSVDEILGIDTTQAVQNKQIETMQSNQSYLGNYDQLDKQDLNENTNTLEMSQEGLEMYKEKIELSEEFQEAVERENLTEEESIDLIESKTEADLDAAAHLKKLKTIVEDYNEAIEDGNEIERAEAIANMQKELEDWFGVAFSAEEVEQYSKDIQKALEGDADSIAALYDYAAEKSQKSLEESVQSFESAGGKLDDTIKESLDLTGTFNDLTSVAQSAFDIINNQDWQFGDTLGAEATNAFNALLASGAITADQLNTYLSNVGFDPIISYKQMTLAEAKSTKQVSYMRNADGTYTEITSETNLADNAMVYVPVLGEKTKYTGTPTPPSLGNSNKGGGGSSKKPTKKNDSDKERYHTVTNQLEDLQDAYDDVSEAADRAFGAEKLKLLDDQIKATDDLIDKQEEYIDAIEANLEPDKQAFISLYDKYIQGPEIQFDASGNISNFDEIQDAMYDLYNKNAESMSEEDWEIFEEHYEQVEKYLEQYEETYDLLREEENELQDLMNQRIDLLLEKVQYEVELKLGITEDSLEVLDYQLGRLEDDAFAVAETLGLLGQSFQEVQTQLEVNTQGMKDVLKQSGVSDVEIQGFIDGSINLESLTSQYSFTEEQINSLREYKSGTISALEAMQDLREEAQDKLSGAFDAWNEQLQDSLDTFDHLNNTLESYKNIIDIVGEDMLNVSKELMDDLNSAIVDNAINQLDGSRRAWEALQSAEETAKQALAGATASGIQEDINFWEDELERINAEEESAQETMLSNWENTLTIIVEQFEQAVEDAVESFNKSFTADGTFLSDAYDQRQKENDRYIEDYQKIYELSKLTRDINNSIDDTDNLASKGKLKELLAEINEYEAEGVQMSEYDVEYLQKKYDLYKAQIALQEAQAAKDTVRLTRDNEGNFSYAYTTDESKVAQAEQDYEDALYALQELNYEYLEEMENSIVETMDEMTEVLADIKREDFATLEEYYAEIDRVQNFYMEQIAYYQNEMQNDINRNKELYEEDWEAYNRITGYKISANEDFITSWKETTLGQLTESESETVDIYQRVVDSLDVLIAGLLNAYNTMSNDIDRANEAAGTSTETFGEDFEEVIDTTIDESESAGEAVEDMATQMEAGFDTATTALLKWQSQYSSAMEQAITDTMGVVDAFNLLIETLVAGEPVYNASQSSSSNSESSSYSGRSNSNSDLGQADTDSPTIPTSPASTHSRKEAMQEAKAQGVNKSSSSKTTVSQWIDNLLNGFATGGYTGDWGDSSGRLALLHKKELVLNEQDTSNMLSAVQLVRSLTQTIDLNAQTASAGLGILTALSLRDEKQADTLQQEVTIHAEFPNVQDQNEIKLALSDLVNTASQYANRK